MAERPFCARCQEDFPVSRGPGFGMGWLTDLNEAPALFRERYRDWLDHPEGHYLCGNCYFDLTDGDE